MLKDVIEAANESMFIEDEQYVLVVDLFILRPELQLQVTTGDLITQSSHHHLSCLARNCSQHNDNFRYLMEGWRV